MVNTDSRYLEVILFGVWEYFTKSCFIKRLA